MQEDDTDEFWAKCREFGIAVTLMNESRRRPASKQGLLDEVDDSLVLAAELGF